MGPSDTPGWQSILHGARRLRRSGPFPGVRCSCLVRKNYRTFRVGTIREGDERSGKLSMREAGLVWLWILGPQLALILATNIITWSYVLPPETVRTISGLSLGIEFLVVGPYEIALALRVKYPGFRLQAYGFRYI
jgi:hypothetical protein